MGRGSETQLQVGENLNELTQDKGEVIALETLLYILSCILILYVCVTCGCDMLNRNKKSPRLTCLIV